MEHETEAIARFFDGEACCRGKRSRRRPVGGVSETLLDALEAVGLSGSSVLDLGCGVGGLTREALARGAARATGIDLSPRTIEEARRLAAGAGLGGRAEFRVGNVAQDPLARHDLVVLDKLICCFPDFDGLLANSIPAAGAVYAVSVPESRGLLGFLSRVAVGLENLLRRIRRDPFRAYVHDVGLMHSALEEAGFRSVSGRHKLVWYLAVFVREGP